MPKFCQPTGPTGGGPEAPPLVLRPLHELVLRERDVLLRGVEVVVEEEKTDLAADKNSEPLPISMTNTIAQFYQLTNADLKNRTITLENC